MAFHVPEDDAITTVAVARPVGGSTLVLADGARFGTDGAPKLVTIRRGTPPDDVLVTVLESTGRTGNTLSSVVASAGHADAAVAVGDVAFLGPVKLHVTELQDAVTALEAGGGAGDVLDVKDFGAVGDGIADDTAAVAAAIAAVPFVDGIRTVYFPAGTYKVSATFVVNRGMISFLGSGREASKVIQATANVPIFLWNNDSGGWNRSIRFAHLGLAFAARPTPATTQQYAIQFRLGVDGTLVAMDGPYYCLFEDLRIDYAYVGVGTYAAGSALISMWGCVWRDLWFHNTQHMAIKLDSPIGQPFNSIEHCTVTNYDATIVADGPVVAATSNQGLSIKGLNVEDWYNTLLIVGGGGTALLEGIRIERHRLTADYPVVFYLADGQFTADHVEFNSYVAHQAGYAMIFRVVNPARLDLTGFSSTYDSAASTPGTVTVFLVEDDGPNLLAGLQIDGNMLAYLPVGYGPFQWGRSSVEGLPPVVDSLPAASATYRGRSLAIRGGVGMADLVYDCEKDATDAYVWVARGGPIGGGAIGDPIGGATAGRVLFAGAGGVLADSAKLRFDVAFGRLQLGPPVVNETMIDLIGETGSTFGIGWDGADVINWGKNLTRLVTHVFYCDGASGIKPLTIGGTGYGVRVRPLSGSWVGLGITGLPGQSAPLLSLQGITSTSAVQNQAIIDATWVNSTDASRTARVTLSACDWVGPREGLRVEADGTQARLGFYGAAAVAKPSGSVTAALAALGLVSAPTLGTGEHWTWVLASGVPATTGADRTNWLVVQRAVTLASAAIVAKTAPTGSSLIVDLLFSINGGTSWTSIWTTTANRLTLAVGAKTATTSTFDTTSLAAGTLLRIDLIQVGSTVAGQDITVQLAT